MKKKKKLLIATDNFLPRWDGISRFLIEIIPDLIKEYEVTVIGPDNGPFKPEGYKLIKIKKSKIGLGDYKAPKFKSRTIKKEVKKADIIFTQTIGPIGTLAIFYGRKKRKKIATYVHSLEWELVPMSTNNYLLRRFLYPITKVFTKFIYNKPDLLIVPSSLLSDALTWRGINTRKKVATLGVDCEVFKPLYEKTEKEVEQIKKLKEELKLKGSYVIGNHGRIANEKDLVTLIRAFNWFKKKHKNTKLLVIGNGVEQIENKLRKTKGCILLSAKNDVQQYLNLMDVYVTSSLTETTSLTTLEAMATSLPVISTPVGFIKEYIKNNKNGLLFKPKDSFELHTKLNYLKKNPGVASRMGVLARKTVLDSFQWKNTAKKIKEALNSLES